MSSRFETTFKALRDCESVMWETEGLSRHEEIARKQLIRLCIEIAREFGDEIGYYVTAEQCQ